MTSSNLFCVYLTIYRGNRLPPFYIGSSSIQKVNEGYRGQVSSKKYKHIWRYELKHNPQNFKTVIVCHTDTRQSALEKEEKLHRLLSVAKNDLYINQGIASANGAFGRMYHKERMKYNNPMFNKDIAKKVGARLKIGRKNGEYKSSSNKPATLEKSKERMKYNNPMFNKETLNKMLNSRKPEDSGKGMIWVANIHTKQRTRIPPDKLEQMSHHGWIKLWNRRPIPDSIS